MKEKALFRFFVTPHWRLSSRAQSRGKAKVLSKEYVKYHLSFTVSKSVYFNLISAMKE
jgi:hypothetical protein